MVDLSPRAHKLQILIGLIAAFILFSALVTIPKYSLEPINKLDNIKQNGVLKVITLNAASTYYEDASGPNGFEYHLAKSFADFIGVELQIILVDQFSNTYPELVFDTADIAAAGLSEQDIKPNSAIEFSSTYHQVTQQILYRKGQQPRPKNLDDLMDGTLEVIDGTSHIQLLSQLQKKHPELSWHVNTDMASEELIELVDEGLIDYILADSHEIALQRRFYPELRVAFELGVTKQLRWAIKKSSDKSLLNAINAFFTEIKSDGLLDQLVHRHYSHVAKFNYSDIQTFSNHVRNRLPEFEELFKKEAKVQGLDWRLLAAIGYQESMWNPKAKSPTGVRGLMMLTLNTAKHVKIKNRLDPAQSIRGGAIYFKRILAKIPPRIQQPDRLWFALASYNVGFGHLEDARIISTQRGADPDKWIDVKKSLPLLGRKKWYKNTKYGYARGWEPVKYVENIRKYYDLLVWKDLKQNEGVNNGKQRLDKEQLTIPPSL